MKIRKTLVILAAAVALGISGCGDPGAGIGDEGVIEEEEGIVEE